MVTVYKLVTSDLRSCNCPEGMEIQYALGERAAAGPIFVITRRAKALELATGGRRVLRCKGEGFRVEDVKGIGVPEAVCDAVTPVEEVTA